MFLKQNIDFFTLLIFCQISGQIQKTNIDVGDLARTLASPKNASAKVLAKSLRIGDLARTLASPKNASAKVLAKSLAKGYLARTLASHGMG